MPNDPVIPVGFAIGAQLIALLWIGLSLAALITVLRSETLSRDQRMLWALAVWLLPFVGAAAWLATHLVEKRSKRRQQNTRRTD